ncbi:actin filament-associated protein 1-like 2 isoform X2 [Megalops cyprinoides]|uniref:actin filament-associated protein 1-like 2 isoform X2 n=1 Tax=Megalops cyprinoides TaxID=118141 RepID=UPI0018643BC7|nr:actin filament-associated protein 1-like 2 isoform X2 [Megalops cyprinoides]
MDKHKVLAQLLGDLGRFLKLLDQENLSGNATVQKCLLSDLLQSYTSSNGCDEEYIYMNKVMVGGQSPEKPAPDRADDVPDALTNGRAGKHVPAPQKSLPDLPQPRACIGREPLPLPMLDSPEGYYEEAQPYDTATNDDCEAVSSSYESYDEEEVTKGKSSTPHQWPSTEASIELMKDARICAFLWRKKWLGQWAKQLCVIKEQRLLCYKSSKDQTPQLDVSLVGCSVVYKEKQLKKKEHKLRITPVGAEAIVLGLQSKEQTEQWLKAIQEISNKPVEISEVTPCSSDSARLICTKGELVERHSVASESGSSTDSHAETPETKDVKKKYGAGLKFSNLMNIGKKKTSSLDSPEKSMDTSGFLNVLVNSQWRARWCLIKNGQLWFYQDKAKTKVAQQPVNLAGCMVLPDPSPDHLYSFRIQQDGEQLATLEAKSSADMGHWLGLLLSQTGTKTDPEELTYDYVDSDRISCIVNAARNSMYLMQRRFSEPNTYTDSLPVVPNDAEDIYDDVASIGPEPEPEESPESSQEAVSVEPDAADRVYLDLIPVRSFLHTSCGRTSPQTPRVPSPSHSPAAEVVSPPQSDPEPSQPQNSSAPPVTPSRAELEQPCPSTQTQPQRPQPPTPLPNADTHKPPQPSAEPQRTPVPNAEPQKAEPQRKVGPCTPSPQPSRTGAEGSDRARPTAAAGSASIEVKLGKNRTEADVLRYTEERDRLEREKEQVRNTLATLRQQRRELKEALASCKDPAQQRPLEVSLREKEEACREEEKKRVDLELQLVEVKESLKKVEAGPFTLGTAVDSGLLDTPKAVVAVVCAAPPAPSPSAGDTSPVNSATALKNRPLSIMATSKGNVLQKAKEWEKKAST